MKIIINKSKCTMCGKCAEICPMNLIKLYQAVKVVHYDGTDAIVEDPKGDQAKAMFLELRSGSLLPESNEGYDLTWYDEDGLDLDAIITMCAI